MLTSRAADYADVPSVTEIYNQGIEDRSATFETAPRTRSQIESWFNDLPFVVVTNGQGEVVGYAKAFAYADRCCYAGIAEFSVYVRREWRGKGVGVVAMKTLIQHARARGLWKLLSRVFPENKASRALMTRMGFQEIGTHKYHGKLDGVWRDCVVVELVIPENLA